LLIGHLAALQDLNRTKCIGFRELSQRRAITSLRTK
jgi:hypothetical protein